MYKIYLDLESNGKALKTQDIWENLNSGCLYVDIKELLFVCVCTISTY